MLEDSDFDGLPEIAPGSWLGYENVDATLPTALFLRDSYFELFADFTATNFHQSIGIHYENMAHFEEYVEYFEPDVVIFEAAERQIAWFAEVVSGY